MAFIRCLTIHSFLGPMDEMIGNCNNNGYGISAHSKSSCWEQCLEVSREQRYQADNNKIVACSWGEHTCHRCKPRNECIRYWSDPWGGKTYDGKGDGDPKNVCVRIN